MTPAPPPRNRSLWSGRWPLQRLVVVTLAIALVVGLLVFPVRGRQMATRLSDGKFISFVNEYRLWPLQRTTHLFLVFEPDGRPLLVFPFARNAGVQFVEFRSNPDQSRIWLVDRSDANQRRVVCVYQNDTSQALGLGAAFPDEVSSQSGAQVR